MPQEMRRIVGERLREARVAASKSQNDVARELGRSRQAVSSWENGKTTPDLFELRQLLVLYALSADRILFGADDIEDEVMRAIKHARRALQPTVLP